MLERPVIKQEFEPNYAKIVEMMYAELQQAKEIYDAHTAIRTKTGKMQLHKNMPKVSGSMKWSAELRQRITVPMESFKHIEHPYVY